VAILVAIMMTALLGLVAIVVDLGLAQDGRRQAQSAVDSAALAAATKLSLEVFVRSNKLVLAEPRAVTAVKTYATANAGIDAAAWAGCTDSGHLADTPDAPNTCISFDATKARVLLPTQDSPSSFGGLFGAGPIGVTALAVALWARIDATPATCWLCVQSQSASVGLNAADGQVSLDAGDIRVGTTGAATLSITSGKVATTGQIGYTGTPPTKGSGSYSPAPVRIASTSPEADPPAPALGPITANPTGPSCSPGVYANITQCKQFSKGIYVLTGPNVFSGGTAAVRTDAGTTFYLTCTDGSAAVPCRGAANTVGGSLTWSQMTADFRIEGPAPGMSAAIVVDPQNTAQQRLVDTSGLRATSRDTVTVIGGIDAPGSQLFVAARNHRFPTTTAWNTVILDVTGRITVDRLTVTGLGASLHQHGAPTSGSTTSTPVPVHLVQ
jgi:hypothetical protein